MALIVTLLPDLHRHRQWICGACVRQHARPAPDRHGACASRIPRWAMCRRGRAVPPLPASGPVRNRDRLPVARRSAPDHPPQICADSGMYAVRPSALDAGPLSALQAAFSAEPPWPPAQRFPAHAVLPVRWQGGVPAPASVPLPAARSFCSLWHVSYRTICTKYSIVNGLCDTLKVRLSMFFESCTEVLKTVFPVFSNSYFSL